MDLPSPDKHLLPKELVCLKEAFALVDRNRDGEITKDELSRVGGLSS